MNIYKKIRIVFSNFNSGTNHWQKKAKIRKNFTIRFK